MQLTSGSRLGGYEILSPIGAGGMGEAIAPGTPGWGASRPNEGVHHPGLPYSRIGTEHRASPTGLDRFQMEDVR